MTRRRNRLTRRAWLKELGAAGAGSVLAAGTLIRQPAFAQSASSSRSVTPDGTITPKTSTSDVFVPPRGRGFQKFSFDCPEPSVAFDFATGNGVVPAGWDVLPAGGTTRPVEYRLGEALFPEPGEYRLLLRLDVPGSPAVEDSRTVLVTDWRA